MPDNPVLKEICLHMFQKYNKTTKFYIKKYFQRNTGNIKGLLTIQTEDECKRMKIKNNQYEQIKKVLVQNRINPNTVDNESYYRKTGTYGILCRKLKMQNSLKNRVNLYVTWKRHNSKHVDIGVDVDTLKTLHNVDETSELDFKVDLDYNLYQTESPPKVNKTSEYDFKNEFDHIYFHSWVPQIILMKLQILILGRIWTTIYIHYRVPQIKSMKLLNLILGRIWTTAATRCS